MTSRVNVFAPVVLTKVLALQLALKLTQIIAQLYPFLLKECQRIVNRLQPVRVSHHGRRLRAWGRDYSFSATEAPFVRKLFAQWELGLSVELPEGCFEGHEAVTDGVLKLDGGVYWLQEPDEEQEKPPLVLFLTEDDPYAGLDKEALAIAWMLVQPEWTDEQIATKIGMPRTGIYRFKKYRHAKEAMKEGRQSFNQKGYAKKMYEEEQP